MEKDPNVLVAEAKTLAELSIHLSYIGEKINTNNKERTQDLNDIKETLKDVAKNQVTRSEFNELKETVKGHVLSLNNLYEFKNNLTGKLWGVGVIAGLVVGFLNLFIGSFFN